MSSSVASHDAEFLTPAMRYRRALTELDGMGRVIMKLEHRWNKNLKKWTAAAVKVLSATPRRSDTFLTK